MKTSASSPAAGLRPAARRFATLALIALVVSGATRASAQIESYSVRKEKAYRQTADATITADYFRFDAQVRSLQADDLNHVELWGMTDEPVYLTQNGRHWSYSSIEYASSADLDAAYPDGHYWFSAGGPIYPEPRDFSVLLEPTYPTALPMLTGTTFSGLSSWDPTSGDFLMTFNSHGVVPGPTHVHTYVTFYDQTTGDGIPITWTLDPSATSLVLSGGLFQADHLYYGSLQFVHDYADPELETFGALKDLTTTFRFTTAPAGELPPPISAVPEPSTYGLIGAAALALAIGLRRRRAACVNAA